MFVPSRVCVCVRAFIFGVPAWALSPDIVFRVLLVWVPDCKSN